MSADAPRPLTGPETELLDAFLAHDFPGVEALRTQTRGLLVKRGCVCGCGTIDFIPQGEGLAQSAPTYALAEVAGYVSDPDGNPLGGVLLWLADGLLSSLEVYWYDSPIAIPSVNNVEWELDQTDR